MHESRRGESLNLLEAVILGIVQGLTEFLPVSSSGHLVLAQELLDVHVEGITFEVFVHFGTLLSVVFVYRRELAALIRAFGKGLAGLGRIREHYRMDRYFRWVAYIIIGTIPAGAIGVQFEAPIERAFNDPRLVAVMLGVTGTILLLTRYIRPPQRELTLARAVLVGCAQAVAILPGLSRSGTTISAALFLGVGKEEAVRFSFLLSIPVILGATLLKLGELLRQPPAAGELLGLAAGTGAAFISGYSAIKFLIRVARGGKLDYFAWYCYAAGIAGWIYF